MMKMMNGLDKTVAERNDFFSNHKDFYKLEKSKEELDFYSDFKEDKLTYALYGTLPIGDITDKIQDATNKLWQVLLKTKDKIVNMNTEELEKLGFNSRIHDYIKLDYLTNYTALSRFDFIVKDNKVKMMEINSETPFLIQEVFRMNNPMCKAFDVESVNLTSLESLQKSYTQALNDAANYLGKKLENCTIAFVSKSYEDDMEEYLSVDFIRQAVNQYLSKNIPLIDLEKLAIRTGIGMYSDKDVPIVDSIDILIRPAYPLEFIIDSISNEDDEEIGYAMLELVKEKKLALINNPAGHILQSKAIMALVWENRNNDDWYTPEDQIAIQEYMLPTYYNARNFVENNQSYIRKTMIGREGSSIEIVDKEGKIEQSEYMLYEDFEAIYQEYVELPEILVKVNDEGKRLKYIIGSFVANNEYAGMGCRVGKKITDWYSHWLAISK